MTCTAVTSDMNPARRVVRRGTSGDSAFGRGDVLDTDIPESDVGGSGGNARPASRSPRSTGLTGSHMAEETGRDLSKETMAGGGIEGGSAHDHEQIKRGYPFIQSANAAGRQTTP